MEVSYECWQDLVCSDHGVRSMDKLFPNRGALWWRLGRAAPDLLRAVSSHGFCTTDLARESSRHRSDSWSQLEQAVRHGISPQRSPLHLGRCQRVARLANLVRLGRSSDPTCSQTLFGRGLGARSQEYGLCIGRHHHRSVPEPVRVGAVSQSQGSRQVAHTAGPQGLDSRLHSHQRRQDARGQCAGHLGLGARGVLRYGPRLLGLCSPVSNAQGGRLLCNPRQKQYERQARVLGQSGQGKRHHLRSIHCTERALYLPRLPRTPAAYPLQRSRNPTDVGLLDQQHKLAALDHRCVVQKPLAGGIVFQMDQAAPAHQEVSGQQRERSQDANLVRRVHLRAHSHC